MKKYESMNEAVLAKAMNELQNGEVILINGLEYGVIKESGRKTQDLVRFI